MFRKPRYRWWRGFFLSYFCLPNQVCLSMFKTLRLAMLLLPLGLITACGSSEPTNDLADLDQSKIDEYNAMIAAEAKEATEAGDIGKGE
ncbi:MAG: hypothetical protein NXI28_19815 [bacterium]|uniref:hypothetical protein n=1 Tax=Rhodopirellula baltica TaxID=265606 RepID=UPI0002F6AD23|nr:hypothetical protein [Rhodopirellula baltica]MCR9210480.1 hypothetical protein [bacterium]